MGSLEGVDVTTAAYSRRDLLARHLRQRAATFEEVFPLSPGQSALLFLHRMAPRSPAYNVAFVARIVSGVDSSALEKALQRLIDRHPALRTVYREKDDGPCQLVFGAMELHLQEIDASYWSHERLTREVHEAFSQPYDLENGPVFRALLFNCSPDNHVLLFGIHHIATDGWSQGILLNELQELYSSYVERRVSCLPAPGISYGESVARRSEVLESETGREMWAFWQDTLRGELPVLDLPTDYPRPAVLTMQGDSCNLAIGQDCYQRLRSLAKDEGVTFFVLTLAAFQVLLMRYTGKTDILVGTPMAARSRKDFENVVGYFMNSVVLRGDLSGGPSFRSLLHRFRDVALGALSHQDFPFPLLVKRICPERDANRSPIFQVMFNLQSSRTLGPFAELLAGDDSSEPIAFGGMRLKGFPLHQGAGAFDLIVELIDTGSRISGTLMYSQDLFKKETVARMADHFVALLKEIAHDPDCVITRLPILTENERSRISDAWNATRASYPTQACVHHLIRAQAEKTPEAIAVSSWDRQLTYRQLQETAQAVAARLQDTGVEAGSLVGVCVERSALMVAAILGVLEAGCAYIPMDPGFPTERLALMVKDACCPAILTQRSLADGLPPADAKVICVDDVGATSASARFRPLLDQSAESLAYVIYTSGSTGKPKGVEISHRALVNFLCSMRSEPGINAQDVLLSVTTISFDIFGLEIFLPLISGAREVIVKRDSLADGRKLLHELSASKATIMQATPATWRLLLEAGWKHTTGLKVLCGGEALPRDLADRILSTGAELWNLYGPTETTIWSSVCKVGRGSEPPRIGHPIANTQLYVVDGDLNLLPVGLSGELLVGGHGLARGYRSDPALTERKFIPDTLGSQPNGRLYRTGDIVRRLPDGSLEYIARMDHQVKLRGYRIELGEIESTLQEADGIDKSVVMVREDTPGNKMLVAYYTPKDGTVVNVPVLRKSLERRLPAYMIPSAFVPLATFPLTPNRKIDRKALPRPSDDTSRPPAHMAPPRTRHEMLLAGMWKSLLGIKEASIRDNFFELGGDSLLAARLFAEIEKKTNRNIPLATLFHSPTIEALARSLDDARSDQTWSIIVPIRAEGSKPPLFLVHGAEGNVLLYRSLAKHLGEDQPVYGLQSEGLDGRPEFHPTMEAMARMYVEEVRKVQPQGPYFLGGYCLGGAIALEMANQLQRSGEEIALLAMFETYNLQESRIRSIPLMNFVINAQSIVFHLFNTLSLGRHARAQFLKEKINTEVSRFRIRSDRALSRLGTLFGMHGAKTYRHVNVGAANDIAHMNYVPQSYQGCITLFRPKWQFLGYRDPSSGWKKVARLGVDVRILPFFPRGMLVPPFVSALAKALAEVQQQASTSN